MMVRYEPYAQHVNHIFLFEIFSRIIPFSHKGANQLMKYELFWHIVYILQILSGGSFFLTSRVMVGNFCEVYVGRLFVLSKIYRVLESTSLENR